jgi:hypothetical protein
MDTYINNYGGHWGDGDDHHIHVTIVNENTARVSFLSGEILQPINRPWCNSKPSVEMEAHYYPFEGPELLVELCDDNTGFCLHLLYEEDLIINGTAQESLQPSIIRYEKDELLDQYYPYFGELKSYTRQNQ